MFDGMIKYNIQGGLNFELPQMYRVRQKFDNRFIENPYDKTKEEFNRINLPDLHGKRVGITVGSRHLDNLPTVLRALSSALHERGAYPFIIPAMGSHGKATAEGQKLLLKSMGISRETVGMEIVSCMDTVEIDKYTNGAPIVCSKTALEADYIIVCARIKAHTSIEGSIESGLCKMMVVGLGKHVGATNFHRQGYHRLAEVLPKAAESFLAKTSILCGIALVENAYDQTAHIEAIQPERIISREKELLVLAKSCMPMFLMDEIDVLIVDQIGKEISGAGMDPNITGRAITPLPAKAAVPIKSIVVLDLTEASGGNAIGIGGADITTQHFIKKMNFAASYTNAFTSGAFAAIKIPVILNNDEEAIKVAIRCAPVEDRSKVKVVHISDTLHLGEIDVSESCLPSMKQKGNIEILRREILRFDERKRLISSLLP